MKKSYPLPVFSAITLLDNTGVAVVEPKEVKESNNAVIFNADGSERFRVKHPSPLADGWFEQIYYVRTELTAFALERGRSFDYAIAVDGTSGAVLRTYDTK